MWGANSVSGLTHGEQNSHVFSESSLYEPPIGVFPTVTYSFTFLQFSESTRNNLIGKLIQYVLSNSPPTGMVS